MGTGREEDRGVGNTKGATVIVAIANVSLTTVEAMVKRKGACGRMKILHNNTAPCRVTEKGSRVACICSLRCA